MTDKVVNLTYGGTIAYPTDIDINITTTNLNASNAVYLMDVYTVVYNPGSNGMASKDIVYLERVGGSNTIYGSDNVWSKGTTIAVDAFAPSSNILRIRIGITPSIGSAPYRCFITAYAKDSTA